MEWKNDSMCALSFRRRGRLIERHHMARTRRSHVRWWCERGVLLLLVLLLVLLLLLLVHRSL